MRLVLSGFLAAALVSQGALAQTIPVLCAPKAAQSNDVFAAQADSLRALAKRLHPDASAPEKHNAFVVVGLVFDSSCRLLKHAVGTRQGRATADTVLARIMPDMPGGPTSISGFVELGPRTAAEEGNLAAARMRHDLVDIGTPWVVWTVKR